MISVQGIFFYMNRLSQPKFSRFSRYALELAIAACLSLSLINHAEAKVPSVGLFSHLLLETANAEETNLPDAFISSASTTSESLVPTTSLPKTLDLFPLPAQAQDDYASDMRAQRLDAYFVKHNMPLAGYGADFIAASEECNMEWQLLPAIAVRESSGGKRMRLNNPFGWASAKVGFDDLHDAIKTVGEHVCGLNPATAKYYKNKTTYQKLYVYNGTVLPSYPDQVVGIMNLF